MCSQILCAVTKLHKVMNLDCFSQTMPTCHCPSCRTVVLSVVCPVLSKTVHRVLCSDVQPPHL
uniref:Uncharacterized protein n=1 Tax=Anguilla anguilla TaxID=7936 RepID=A0A0E9WIC5_ANGAN